MISLVAHWEHKTEQEVAHGKNEKDDGRGGWKNIRSLPKVVRDCLFLGKNLWFMLWNFFESLGLHSDLSVSLDDDSDTSENDTDE